MSLKTLLAQEATAVSSWFKTQVVPWFESVLKNVAHDEVAVLLPIASSAAGALGAELASNSGNLSAFAESASKILKDTAAKAEAASIQAAGTSLIAAVTTAIVAHAAAAPLGGEAPPPVPAPAPVKEPADDEEPAKEPAL